MTDKCPVCGTFGKTMGDETKYFVADTWMPIEERLPSCPTETFYGGPEGSWGCTVVLRLSEGDWKIVYFDGNTQKFWHDGKIVTGTHWHYVPLLQLS